MKTYYERLKASRKAAKLTQTELANKLGGKVTHNYVSKWESGGYKPDAENERKLIKILNLNSNWLVTGKGEQFVSNINLSSTLQYMYIYPVVHWETACKWSECMDKGLNQLGRFASLHESKGESFALEIEGESMLPRFRPGDHILVDTGIKVKSSDHAIVKINEDTAIFRQIIIEGGKMFMKALNPDWPNKLQEFTIGMSIIGKVIEKRELDL